MPRSPTSSESWSWTPTCGGTRYASPHLVTTVHGLPVAFALATAKTDEREVLVDLFDLDNGLLTHPDGLILVVDKGYRDAAAERQLAERGVKMIRPAYRTEKPRPGRILLRALRQR